MNLKNTILVYLFLSGLGLSITIKEWNNLSKTPFKIRLGRLLVLNIPIFLLLSLLFEYWK